MNSHGTPGFGATIQAAAEKNPVTPSRRHAPEPGMQKLLWLATGSMALMGLVILKNSPDPLNLLFLAPAALMAYLTYTWRKSDSSAADLVVDEYSRLLTLARSGASTLGLPPWEAGAVGEIRTADRLHQDLGHTDFTVGHDLVLPGTDANIDHAVAGTRGRLIVIDSKAWNGTLEFEQTAHGPAISRQGHYGTAVSAVLYEVSKMPVTPYAALIAIDGSAARALGRSPVLQLGAYSPRFGDSAGSLLPINTVPVYLVNASVLGATVISMMGDATTPYPDNDSGENWIRTAAPEP